MKKYCFFLCSVEVGLNGLVPANALRGGEAKTPESIIKLINFVLFNIDDIFNSYYPAKEDKIVLKN